jgi:hypothetical protein
LSFALRWLLLLGFVGDRQFRVVRRQQAKARQYRVLFPIFSNGHCYNIISLESDTLNNVCPVKHDWQRSPDFPQSSFSDISQYLDFAHGTRYFSEICNCCLCPVVNALITGWRNVASRSRKPDPLRGRALKKFNRQLVPGGSTHTRDVQPRAWSPYKVILFLGSGKNLHADWTSMSHRRE